MKEKIEEYCRELRIGTIISEEYHNIKAETHEEFLVKLLAISVSDRNTRRKNRLLKQAAFDVIKTFENFNFQDIEIPDNITVEEVKKGNFIDKQENLILYGPVGTGKTHLATAIGVDACRDGKKVKFFRTAVLVNELIEAKKKDMLNHYLKKLEALDLLICDEWGYIPLDSNGAQLLFQVVASCYEKRSVIITTNLEFGKWDGIFYDRQMTSAIIDRLIHHSYLIMFTGESYRLKNSTIKNR